MYMYVLYGVRKCVTVQGTWDFMATVPQKEETGMLLVNRGLHVEFTMTRHLIHNTALPLIDCIYVKAQRYMTYDVYRPILVAGSTNLCLKCIPFTVSPSNNLFVFSSSLRYIGNHTSFTENPPRT